jgi:hypothetical protein
MGIEHAYKESSPSELTARPIGSETWLPILQTGTKAEQNEVSWATISVMV